MSDITALLLVILVSGLFFGGVSLVLKIQIDRARRDLRDEEAQESLDQDRAEKDAERERRRLDLAARLERARSAQKRVRSPFGSAGGGMGRRASGARS